MELIPTEFDGKIGIVKDVNHPHYGAKCTCMGAEFVSALEKYAMRFKRDDTMEEFFIFDGRGIVWLPANGLIFKPKITSNNRR